MKISQTNFMKQPWASGVTLLVCVIIAMLLANLPVLPDGVDVDASRTVSEHGGWNAETWNFYGDACCSGHQFLLMSEHGTAANETVVTTAHENLGFLLKGHSFKHLVDIIGAELGLRICCHSKSR